MLKVALATYSGNPQLCDDDRLLLPEFDRAGVSCTIAVWDDPTINWMTFDAVVLRSCWDYHLRPQSFIAWLKMLDAWMWPSSMRFPRCSVILTSDIFERSTR